MIYKRVCIHSQQVQKMLQYKKLSCIEHDPPITVVYYSFQLKNNQKGCPYSNRKGGEAANLDHTLEESTLLA